MNKKLQATGLLVLMLAGMLLTAGKEGFFIKLLHNGFLAAMIGGLADWFAVTALFRKPLGISWRTAILPRNRGRIMDELINFISKDLLNSNNIMKDVVRYDMGQMLVDYLTKKGGTERLYTTITSLGRELIKKMDITAIVTDIQDVAKKNDEKLYKEVIVNILAGIINSKQLDVFIKAVGIFINTMLADKKMQSMLQQLIHDVKNEYKSGSTLREMAIAMLDLSDESITQDALGKLNAFITKWDNKDDENRKKLQIWLRDTWLVDLQQDDKYNEIFAVIGRAINKNSDFVQISNDYWGKLLAEKQIQQELFNKINNIIDGQLKNFINDKNIQKVFDGWLKDKLAILVEKSAPYLLNMIKDKLNSYSTEEFTALVEDHISSDLQMIRINGSLVGGMAGMALYVLTYMAERFCN